MKFESEYEPGRLESSRPVPLGRIARRARRLVTALTLLASASAARAQGGISLAWNDCPASSLSSSHLIAACANQDREQLFISFSLAQPADSVIALEAVVDVQSAAASLPEWWRYEPGGCRYGMLTASADFFGFSACADPWEGLASLGGPPVYAPTAPHGGANQARIIVTFDVLTSRQRSLDAATAYYAARLIFRNDPAPTCPGCDVAACLVLNSIRLIRVPGSEGADIVVTTPALPGSNLVTWNGTGADCAAVPVRRHTWGELKSLYR